MTDLGRVDKHERNGDDEGEHETDQFLCRDTLRHRNGVVDVVP